MRIFGIPVQDALFLRDLLNLITFVEGGTHIDDTAKTMAGLFQKVITIKNPKHSGKLRKNAPISQMLPFSLETHIDAHEFGVNTHQSGNHLSNYCRPTGIFSFMKLSFSFTPLPLLNQ